MKKGLTDIPMHGALMSNARTANSDQESKAVCKKKDACSKLWDKLPSRAKLKILLWIKHAATCKMKTSYLILRVIIIKFLFVLSVLCKTEWSCELWVWSHKMNLLDILSTSPHYLCRKWRGVTNEKSNFWSKGLKGLLPNDWTFSFLVIFHSGLQGVNHPL